MCAGGNKRIIENLVLIHETIYYRGKQVTFKMNKSKKYELGKMKKLATLLATTILMSAPMFQSYGQGDVQPLTVGIVMQSYTCNDKVTRELMAFAEITYIHIQQYHIPNVPQVYCFARDDSYADITYSFILEYNDYVIFMFEDQLWYEDAPTVLSEKVGIDNEDLPRDEGMAYTEYGITAIHYHNNEPDPNLYIDTHDWNSLTLTHELAHLILYDYGYGEDVYLDWVNERDVFYDEYTDGYGIFAPLASSWYEAFERYPVEKDY